MSPGNGLHMPVEVAGITLKNPFMVASGPTAKSVEQLVRAEECGWAGVSLKLCFDPFPYINKEPRYGYWEDRGILSFSAEKRISIEEDYERRDWAKSLDTTEDKLREAVQAVGTSADKVREYLRGK